MANEITMSVSLSVLNGLFKASESSGAIQITQTTLGAASGLVTVGTVEETLSFTDITTEGLLILQNTDSTNYVTYGPDSTGMVAMGRIKPREWALLRLEPGITFKWQADTAACKVKYLLLED